MVFIKPKVKRDTRRKKAENEENRSHVKDFLGTNMPSYYGVWSRSFKTRTHCTSGVMRTTRRLLPSGCCSVFSKK